MPNQDVLMEALFKAVILQQGINFVDWVDKGSERVAQIDHRFVRFSTEQYGDRLRLQ